MPNMTRTATVMQELDQQIHMGWRDLESAQETLADEIAWPTHTGYILD